MDLNKLAVDAALMNCRTPHKITKKWAEILNLKHIRFLNLLWFAENKLFEMIKDQQLLAVFAIELQQMKISRADESIIYNQYRLLAMSRISKFLKSYPYFYKEKGDIEQECYFIFRRCIYQFNHDKNVRFSTYFVVALIHFFRFYKVTKKKAIRYKNINERSWEIIENKCFTAFDEDIEPLCVDAVIESLLLSEKEIVVLNNYIEVDRNWITQTNDDFELRLGMKRYSKQGIHNILHDVRKKILGALKFHSEDHYDILSAPE